MEDKRSIGVRTGDVYRSKQEASENRPPHDRLLSCVRINGLLIEESPFPALLAELKVKDADIERLKARALAAETERNNAHAAAGALKGIGAQLAAANARIAELETTVADAREACAQTIERLAGDTDCGCKPCHGHPERDAAYAQAAEAVRARSEAPAITGKPDSAVLLATLKQAEIEIHFPGSSAAEGIDIAALIREALEEVEGES